jgi:hypothetical protein
MVPLTFLKPPKGRLTILVETMQSAGCVAARRNSGFLGVCWLHELGGGVLEMRRIIHQHPMIAKGFEGREAIHL